MRRYWILSIWLLTFNLHAAVLNPNQVPAPLQPWVDWVLQDQQELACPHLYANDKQKRCAWPTALKLNLDKNGGSFSQSWAVYADSHLLLPGDNLHWPQQVKNKNQSLVVTADKGRPSVFVTPGNYTISGQFQWPELPDALAVPKDTGLIDLRLSARNIDLPQIDQNGYLRLLDSSKLTGPSEASELNLRVFRLITDDIPLQMLTRIELDVAGLQREVLLPNALLSGFIPLRLDSQLPARLDNNGDLRLQLRAGRYHLELLSRHPGQLDGLTLPALATPWPEQETWAFAARPELRTLDLSGMPAVDPRQTGLPQAWQNFPAYLATADQSLQFKQLTRGNPEPEPDQLHLQRTLWLDFSGLGYTYRDHIHGSMNQAWRLDVQPEVQLGRVLINNEAQLITRLDNDSAAGVEVRRGTLDLLAESRQSTKIGQLMANSWQHDFSSVSAVLNLPPGWDVFTVSGADNASSTWLQRWTLLDMFLVLIISIVILRLWSIQWCLLGLLTLVLTWHQADAPQLIWLHLLAAIALLRVLPEHAFKQWVKVYRNLSLLGFVIIAVPFMIQQVRIGLYPQLDTQQTEIQQNLFEADNYESEDAFDANVQSKLLAPVESMASIAGAAVNRQKSENNSKLFQQIDPDAQLQTGPGLPDWQWRKINLYWNGPVDQTQKLGIYYISPRLQLILNLAQVLLLAVLALLFFGVSLKSLNWRKLLNKSTAATVLIAMALILPSQNGWAQFPDQQLLQDLKSRLLAPADCLPECASLSRLQINAKANQLMLRMELHSQSDVVIPLPGHAEHWLPTQVLIDGKPVSSLARQQGQLLMVLPTGLHQVQLSGVLPNRDAVQISLPLVTHQFSQELNGWSISGLDEQGNAGKQIQLNRVDKLSNSARINRETRQLPAFLRVERNLRLGLQWEIETQVSRISDLNQAVLMEVPLIKGESVISSNINVTANKVQLNLAPGESSKRWTSRLEIGPEILLQAAQSNAWIEHWRLDISNLWHLSSAIGIPVTQHLDNSQNWLPEWRPWPGESLTLSLQRPQGVVANTLTIDRSELNIIPGNRASDYYLSLTLRSSQGGQHSLGFPPDTELQSVSINGINQATRLLDQQLKLPIVPGEQLIEINWRDTQALSSFSRTPSIDLGSNSVNHRLAVTMPEDRWVLLLGGPQLGPAVLIWGMLLVLLLISFALGKIKQLPLSGWQWLLLGLGLSQTHIVSALFIALWFVAIAARARLNKTTKPVIHNLFQVGLAIYTVLMIGLLITAVQQGLLGTPDMQIAGNNSYAGQLSWYQDLLGNMTPSAWILSVPMFVYRILMLAWALWLAFALLSWLRWGWGNFQLLGLWRDTSREKSKAKD